MEKGFQGGVIRSECTASPALDTAPSHNLLLNLCQSQSRIGGRSKDVGISRKPFSLCRRAPWRRGLPAANGLAAADGWWRPSRNIKSEIFFPGRKKALALLSRLVLLVAMHSRSHMTLGQPPCSTGARHVGHAIQCPSTTGARPARWRHGRISAFSASAVSFPEPELPAAASTAA